MTCLTWLQRSALLLVAAPLPSPEVGRRGHIPAKAFEYLGSARPILVVGDTRSDVARLLNPFAHVRVVEAGDVNAARSAIEHLLRDTHSPAASELTSFTRQALAGRLAEVLDQARDAGRSEPMGVSVVSSP
jgi:hypothetical protein